MNCCRKRKDDRYFRSPRASHPLPRSDFPSTESTNPLGETESAVGAGYAVERDIEIGVLAHHATKIGLMPEPGLGIEQSAVGQIIAAIDRPEVADPHGLSPYGAVADTRRQKTAAARLLLQRFVEVWRVKDRNFFDIEPRSLGIARSSGMMSKVGALSRHQGAGIRQSVRNPLWRR